MEKGDIIRAVVGYALAEDAIGLTRFREKYVPLMSGEADRLAFDIASKPVAANSAEFGLIARMAASVDTLDGFIREMKTRFPDATARAPLSPEMVQGRAGPYRFLAAKSAESSSARQNDRRVAIALPVSAKDKSVHRAR